MERYFKIGEISRLYGVGADSLRYYEQVGLLSPSRSSGGYRLYSRNDIWRLNLIRDLLEQGFSTSRIREYIASRSVDSTIDLLCEEKIQVEQHMAQLAHTRAELEQRIAALRRAKSQTTGVVEALVLPPRPCLSLRQPYREDTEMDVLVKRLLQQEPSLHIPGNDRIGSFLPLSQAGSERPSYSGVFVIDAPGGEVLPGGDYLSVCYRGSSRRTRLHAPLLLQRAHELGRSPAGEILELVWVDIHISRQPEEHSIELQLPLL